jgi:hypothetical protein
MKTAPKIIISAIVTLTLTLEISQIAASPHSILADAVIAPSYGSQTLTPEEMNFLFNTFHKGEKNEPKFAFLSEEEAVHTVGKIGPAGAVVGAIGGASAYIGAAMVDGDATVKGLAQATVSGALAGALLGPGAPVVANSILASQVGFYGGMAGALIVNSGGGGGGGSCSSCHSARRSSSIF